VPETGSESASVGRRGWPDENINQVLAARVDEHGGTVRPRTTSRRPPRSGNPSFAKSRTGGAKSSLPSNHGFTGADRSTQRLEVSRLQRNEGAHPRSRKPARFSLLPGNSDGRRQPREQRKQHGGRYGEPAPHSRFRNRDDRSLCGPADLRLYFLAQRPGCPLIQNRHVGWKSARFRWPPERQRNRRRRSGGARNQRRVRRPVRHPYTREGTVCVSSQPTLASCLACLAG